MQNFEFYNPVRIVFGPGEMNRLGELASKHGKKALLVKSAGPLEKLGVYRPQQTEFARLNITYTVLSKRKFNYSAFIWMGSHWIWQVHFSQPAPVLKLHCFRIFIFMLRARDISLTGR